MVFRYMEQIYNFRFYKACIGKYISLCFYSVYVGGRNESAFTRNRIIKTAHEGVE